MNKNSLFMEITNGILNAEDGDMLGLSKLSDLIEDLKTIHSEQNLIPQIDEAVQIVNKAIKKGVNDEFTSLISEKIDYLQKKMNSEVLIENENIQKNEENLHEDRGLGISDELINNFIVEAEGRIATAQELILELENNSSNSELISNLFRVFHTIKGECGFLKIITFGELTHSIENILDLLRNKKIEVDSNLIDRLLEGVDLSKIIIDYLKKGVFIIPDKSMLEGYIDNLGTLKEKVKPNIGDIMIERGKMSAPEVSHILEIQKESAFTKKFGELAVGEKIINQNDLKEGLDSQNKVEKKDDVIVKKTEKTDQIIKVKASKVNYIVDMIGELLIASGQITDNSPAVIQTKKIIKVLQYAGMQLRTDSIKTLFGNAKRMVRDVSKKLGKVVDVEVFGDDLEIDRNLIESLEEPMIHILRNAVHHGIESEDERQAKGKPVHGQITISAERKGNNIVISIKDDGQGLNKDKIIKKALEKGILKADEIGSLSDNQIYNIIFLSGFSTADAIDQVSGRGVGMDIVRSVIEANKGKIEIQTETDNFSRFMFIFPLSTAIIDGMIIRIEDNVLIIPISSIIESIKFNDLHIHSVNSVAVYKLREEVFPIINLKDLFSINQIEGKNNIGIVVENSIGKRFLLQVDEIISKKEVVIKSLGQKFRNLKGISSGCVLAGGKIGLVVDIDQIIEMSISQKKII
ncbi:MAG: hypothetical protein A2015_16025 [Spirochaetes bacterium GWF1_31_7]|nr:MAG: hypothetical protein A2Y30_13400 [Spirochaetes bacterium GWE1_32_154]OHD49962.1 MAG: hypothetical protein A2Y29_11445 [Spirochaetes bacterium GWE2_31_10]OHD52279.1 MAG: hypothetical protein A2015_16025 [Spirochaetes bacterium GWF1_31_7]OHD72982.1 MAG: hypothetical protein A2355_07050 [Spirochaetes bacterium RIFOXYB1_FULL_32_8]